MKPLIKNLARTTLAVAVSIGFAMGAVAADIKVGLSVSLSGPNSSLGVPYAKGMQAALAFRPEVNGRKIQLIVDAQPVPRVQGDAGRLTQLLVNLLDNALAHTPPGGRITVRLTSIPEHVALHVEDTGTGIAPDHLPHIFERFYRADPARARESGGTGLGLAIVKEIAEAHRGTVAVESTPGQGTRFTVILPVCAGDDVSAGR